MDGFIWLALFVIFLVVEANTVALVSSWFAIGALVAMVLSFVGVPFGWQCAAFLVVSCALLASLRPLVRKYIKPKITRTNVDSTIGSTGYVTAPIDNVSALGQVKLGGMEWTARSTDGTILPVGTLVKVDRIEGVKVFVSPAEVKETV